MCTSYTFTPQNDILSPFVTPHGSLKENNVSKRTPLYDQHVKAKAKIVDFSGWEMPLHYGSQLEEHHLVRQKAGVFDVSHMGVVDLAGVDATPYLRRLVANNVDKSAQVKRFILAC